MATTGQSPARRPMPPAPMLATLGKPPTGDRWSIEWKFDGQRALIVTGDGMSIFTRNGAEVTRTFPEVPARIAAALGRRRAMLDGEIVALDTEGRPSFSRLQQRWPQQRRPSSRLLHDVPVRFYAFDILAIDGVDLTKRTYLQRRDILEELANTTPGLLTIPRFASHDVSPAEVLAIARDNAVEGIVSKRIDSLYLPGVRSTAWIKTCHRSRSEFVIGGWLPGEGVNRDAIGALLVGAHDARGLLQFCGTVGAGLSAAHRRTLNKVLLPLATDTSPFLAVPPYISPHARWVKPKAIGDVEYREMTGLLRHPAWKGLRADLDDISRVILPLEPTTESA